LRSVVVVFYYYDFFDFVKVESAILKSNEVLAGFAF